MFLRKHNEVSGFASSLLKYQKKIKLSTQKFHFLKYKKYKNFFRGFRFLKYKIFLRVDFFFFELGLKSAGFHFRKYKKNFLLREYKNLFNIRARKFHFGKYKEFFSGQIFFIFSIFYFFGLGWEVQGSISGNIRIFFNIKARKLHFLKCKEFCQDGFFGGFFYASGWEVHQKALIYNTYFPILSFPQRDSQISAA